MKFDSTHIYEIFEGVYFTEEEITKIHGALKKITLRKGDLLLKKDETVLHQYFNSSGCLRTYYVDSQGKEYTIQFAIKGWWISDYTAYFNSTNSLLYIECIKDAVVYEISKKDLEHLYIEIPQIESFFRRKMEKAFASFQKRIIYSLSQTAKERYVGFLHNYPEIEEMVKNYHIASYLGITTESLSRIRTEISNQ